MWPSRVTGERVVTAHGGFNPTWQRHVAAYRLCAPLLTPGTTLDAGCGVGHSHDALGDRTIIGLDRDPAALARLAGPGVLADMRAIPFGASSFGAVISVHSLEHLPEPDRALAEFARVLRPGGVALVVTPNRLTFASADEIVDPYHHHEWDPDQFRALCASAFPGVELRGIFGSPRYLAFQARELRVLEALLRLDPLRLRRAVPRRALQVFYDLALGLARHRPDRSAETIAPSDFRLGREDLDESLDLVAVCRTAGP